MIDFSIRELESFVAVAEELSFTRAARRLRLSQPPLSRQIQSLENRLGVRLFARTPRSVALTSAGRAFLADTKGALAQLQRGGGQGQASFAGRNHAAGHRLCERRVEPGAHRYFPPLSHGEPGRAVESARLSTRRTGQGDRRRAIGRRFHRRHSGHANPRVDVHSVEPRTTDGLSTPQPSPAPCPQT